MEGFIRQLIMEAIGKLRSSKVALLEDGDEEGLTFSSTVLINVCQQTSKFSVP